MGVTRGLGKETAKAQGGWESDAQDQYPRVGYDQVVQIPGAIVASWQAQESNYDFGGINGPVVDPFSPRAARPPPEVADLRPAPPRDPEPGERTLNEPGRERAKRAARIANSPSNAAASQKMVQCLKLPTGWLVGWQHSRTGTTKKFYVGPSGTSYTTLKSAVSAAGVAGGVLHPTQRPSVPPLPTREAQRAAIAPTMRKVNAARASTSFFLGTFGLRHGDTWWAPHCGGRPRWSQVRAVGRPGHMVAMPPLAPHPLCMNE